MEEKNKTNTIYIIHGWSYNTRRWRPTLEKLKNYGIDCQMLNVPGLTGRPLPGRQKTGMKIEDYCQWLKGELPKESRVVVIGHSNGGRIALNYLAGGGQKIKKLILIGSAGIPAKSRRNLRNKVVSKLAKIFKQLKKVSFIDRAVYKILGAQDYKNANLLMKKTLSNVLASDKKLDLKKVTTPTSLIWGASDQVTPLWQAEMFRKKLPNLKSFRVIEKAGHAPYYSHPEELVELILAEIQDLRL